MKLHTDHVTDAPKRHSHEVGPSWWADWASGASDPMGRVLEDFVFDFSAHTIREDIYLEGTASGMLDAQCSRCLKRYRQPLRETFRLVLECAGDASRLEPEAAEALTKYGLCLGDDLEAGWYRGKELSLDAFFAEVVSLAIPVQPVCGEGCPGLCPHCGVNRSETSCDCIDLKPESPFAVLSALRGDSEGSS